jgi:hypothetical protein
MATHLFDAAALTLFFEDAINMGLSRCTREQLAVEGITVPEDFKEFNKEGMKAIFANLFKPPKVPVTGTAARAAGTLRKIQAYEVSAKQCLLQSSTMMSGALWTLTICRGLLSSVFWSSGRP